MNDPKILNSLVASCRDCEQTLLSKREAEIGTCIGCLKAKVDSFEKNSESSSNLQREFEELQKKHEKLNLALSCHSLGSEAAHAGFNIIDCPFPPETIEWSNWYEGFLLTRLEEKFEEMSGVVRWACESLENVAEIARGYGQTEIAEKSKLIQDRLEFYFD